MDKSYANIIEMGYLLFCKFRSV